MKRVCTSCHEEKDIENFKFEVNRGQYRTQCRTCRNAQRRVRLQNDPQQREKKNERTKQWYWSNRDKAHDNRISKKYNIPLGQYAQLLEKQGGVCAICGETNGNERLVVDHSHQTGEIRGLLCNNCNVMLGYAGDNPKRLVRGALYLEGYIHVPT